VSFYVYLPIIMHPNPGQSKYSGVPRGYVDDILDLVTDTLPDDAEVPKDSSELERWISGLVNVPVDIIAICSNCDRLVFFACMTNKTMYVIDK